MNVRFFAGSKKQYLGLTKYDPLALYFCYDTRELFWGDLLLSDGMRVVATFANLPATQEAADGIVYFVTETRNGYVLSNDRTEWIQVIQAPTGGNGQSIDLSDYFTKSETTTAIAEAIAALPKQEEVDLSGYATREWVIDQGYLTEHQDLSDYAKTATVVERKYEVLPVDGMFILYGDNEVRLNTERVKPTLQNVGATGNANMYYVTFRAFAPEGATRVIEGQSDKMDAEFSSLSVDSYGRKYTTIWAAIASTADGGKTWTKWGDSSTVNKYLGFYYNFHWYNEDTLISTDKVRVILTNDKCHNDLVPDAVARRIDDKVASVGTTINNISQQVTNIEQNYVTTKVLEENYTTTDQLEAKVVEAVQNKVDSGEIAVSTESISYGTW